MEKIYLITIIFLVISHSYFAQVEYAPLQLGNVWIYENYVGSRGRAEIVDSSFMIDTIKYYGFAFGYNQDIAGLIRLTSDGYFVSKQDSTLPEPLNEYKYYKKNAKVGNFWQVNYGGGAPVTYLVTDSLPAYIFDTVVTAKIVREDFGISDPWDYVWTEEFGKLGKYNWQGEPQHYLIGCVIDGRVYGDTNIVTGVNEFVSEISYNLYQNYPNPFNSSTIISFSIPQGDNVLIEVSNILGEKVRTLVNDYFIAGTHSVRFESENLATGVYFCILRINELVRIKKLLLIK